MLAETRAGKKQSHPARTVLVNSDWVKMVVYDLRTDLIFTNFQQK